MIHEVPNAAADTTLLEVIVSSVEDALEAEQGGAGRLEVVRNLELGGLTPTIDTVQTICRRVSIPVRVMLRCSESHSPGPDEVEGLCQEAEGLASLAIDGLVLGFLREGQVDVPTLCEVLSRAPNLRATFHRAFDETADPAAEIERLKRVPQVDRILTSGGVGSWNVKAERLRSYHQAATPKITILAGGGLDRLGIDQLLSETGLREFHTGRAVRVPETPFGKVQAQKVSQLVAAWRY